MTRHFARPVFAVTLAKHRILVVLRATHSMSLRGIDKSGVPAGYFVPVGKRNKQAKDKQLTFTAIVWSKVKFMTRNALYVIASAAWQSPGTDTLL